MRPTLEVPNTECTEVRIISYTRGHRPSKRTSDRVHRRDSGHCQWPDIKGVGCSLAIPQTQHTGTFKMSDINATRLPYVYKREIVYPYVGDDLNHTLTLGQR